MIKIKPLAQSRRRLGEMKRPQQGLERLRRRRACKVPESAFRLAQDRVLSEDELETLSDEALLERILTDIILPTRERGVLLGSKGNSRALDRAEWEDGPRVFFHLEEVRRVLAALPLFPPGCD